MSCLLILLVVDVGVFMSFLRDDHIGQLEGCAISHLCDSKA